MSELRSTTRSAGVSAEVLTLTLLAVAVAGWWATARMSTDPMAADPMMAPMSLAPFLVAWALMMAAMMLPAVTPVVRLYQWAAAAGRVAPTGVFVSAYVVAWALTGLPVYLLWRELSMPVAMGETWALRLAGGVILLAGGYQLTPLKQACLRHCRSPMSYFLRLHGSLQTVRGSFRAGLLHAAYCGGCCAALMVVLVAAAAMNLWWAAVIALGVFVERNLPWGPTFSKAFGLLLVALGAAVLWQPATLSHLM